MKDYLRYRVPIAVFSSALGILLLLGWLLAWSIGGTSGLLAGTLLLRGGLESILFACHLFVVDPGGHRSRWLFASTDLAIGFLTAGWLQGEGGAAVLLLLVPLSAVLWSAGITGWFRRSPGQTVVRIGLRALCWSSPGVVIALSTNVRLPL